MADVRVKFTGDNASVLKSVKGIESAVGGLKSTLTTALSFSGVTLGIAAIGSAIRGLLDDIDNLDRRAKQLNATLEETQRLEFIGTQNKTDLDTINDALLKLNRRLTDAENNPAVARALENLNLNAAELLKLGPDEQLFALADAFSEAEDKASAFNDLYKLVEESARNLLPILRQNREELEATADSAPIIDDQNVRAVAAIKDASDDFRRSVRADVTNVIGGFKELGESIMAAGRAIDFAGENILGGASITSELQNISETYNAIKNAVDDVAEASNRQLIADRELEAEGRKRLQTDKERTKQAELQKSLLGNLRSDEEIAIDRAEQRKELEKEITEEKKKQVEEASKIADAFAQELAFLDAQGEGERQLAEFRKQQREEREKELASEPSAGRGITPSSIAQVGGRLRGETTGAALRGPEKLEQINSRIESQVDGISKQVDQIATAAGYSPESDLQDIKGFLDDGVSHLSDIAEAVSDGIVQPAVIR